jgi:hypothetical protein
VVACAVTIWRSDDQIIVAMADIGLFIRICKARLDDGRHMTAPRE